MRKYLQDKGVKTLWCNSPSTLDQLTVHDLLGLECDVAQVDIVRNSSHASVFDHGVEIRN